MLDLDKIEKIEKTDKIPILIFLEKDESLLEKIVNILFSNKLFRMEIIYAKKNIIPKPENKPLFFIITSCQKHIYDEKAFKLPEWLKEYENPNIFTFSYGMQMLLYEHNIKITKLEKSLKGIFNFEEKGKFKRRYFEMEDVIFKEGKKKIGPYKIEGILKYKNKEIITSIRKKNILAVQYNPFSNFSPDYQLLDKFTKEIIKTNN